MASVAHVTDAVIPRVRRRGAMLAPMGRPDSDDPGTRDNRFLDLDQGVVYRLIHYMPEEGNHGDQQSGSRYRR